MNKNFKSRIGTFAEQHPCSLEWQPLRFHFERAILTFNSSDSYWAAVNASRRLRYVHIETKCFHEGLFEGFIYLMPADDYRALKRKLDEEKAANDAWWEEYHRQQQQQSI